MRKRHDLVVVNGLANKCKGLITRKRITVNSIEQSKCMIDSSELAEIVDNMLVYEEQRFGLVGYIKTKKGLHKKVSDHMALVTTLNCKWYRSKKGSFQRNFQP